MLRFSLSTLNGNSSIFLYHILVSFNGGPDNIQDSKIERMWYKLTKKYKNKSTIGKIVKVSFNR